MSLTIGVDVGGTKVAAGVVDERGTVVEKLRRATPSSSPARTEQVIAGAVTELLSRHRVHAVGLGAAGFIDEERASVRFAPNLAWREEPLRLRVEDLIGLPVVVENDANASAWAEVRFGAARGHAHVIWVGVGTGIGAGIVLDGRLYRGQWGMAGEPGHYRVVPDGRLCGCGNRGCWEQYASGSALVAEAREFAQRSPGAAARLLQLAGGSTDGITGAQVTQAARAGPSSSSPASDTPPPMTKQPGSRMAARSASPWPSQPPTVAKQRAATGSPSRAACVTCEPVIPSGLPPAS